MSTIYGFYFHPATDKDSHGHPKLEFNLYTKPTNAHFDPIRATLVVSGRRNEIDSVSMTHPWRGSRELRVCAGRIVLVDRREKRVAAYSFGGRLTALPEDDHTACLLTSPAPIFDLVNPEDTVTNVISGIEAVIAQQRARWPNDHVFDACLATVSAPDLYVGGLLSLKGELAAIPWRSHTVDTRAQQHMVNEMLAAARRMNLWGSNARLLYLLLAPP